MSTPLDRIRARFATEESAAANDSVGQASRRPRDWNGLAGASIFGLVGGLALAYVIGVRPAKHARDDADGAATAARQELAAAKRDAEEARARLAQERAWKDALAANETRLRAEAEHRPRIFGWLNGRSPKDGTLEIESFTLWRSADRSGGLEGQAVGTAPHKSMVQLLGMGFDGDRVRYEVEVADGPSRGLRGWISGVQVCLNNEFR